MAVSGRSLCNLGACCATPTHHNETHLRGNPFTKRMLCCEFQKVVSQFFKDYSTVVAKWPLPFLVIPVVIFCLAAGAIVQRIDVIEEQASGDRLAMFLPEDVPSMIHLKIMKQVFPSKNPLRDTYDVFRAAYAYIIIEDNSEHQNVLRNEVLTIAGEIHNRVRELTVQLNPYFTANWQSQCLKKKNLCLQHPVMVLLNGSDPYSTVRLFLRYPSLKIGNETVDNAQLFGSVTLSPDNRILTAKAMRLPYILEDNDIYEQKAINYIWQTKFLKLMRGMRYTGLNLYYTTSVSWAEEVDRNGKMLIPYMPVLLAVLVLFSVGSCMTTDWVISKPYVAICGILNALFAVTATLGTLIYSGYPFLQMVFIMPFLILSISVDNMFLMLSSWRTTHPLEPVEKRMSNAIGETAVSVMITGLTDGLSFSVGSISQFPAVRIFCTYCALAVLYVFLYQMTFFTACMALTGRREAANRHCFFFIKCTPKSESKAKPFYYRLLCAGGYFSSGTRRIPGKIETQWVTEFLSTKYADLLCNWITKVLVVFFYAFYLASSIYGVTQLPLGLELKMLVPTDSYVGAEVEATARHFSAYGQTYGYAVIQDPELNFHHRDVINRLLELYYALCGTNYTTEGDFWLKELEKGTNHTSYEDKLSFYRHLVDFLRRPENERFRHDINFAKGGQGITSTKMLIRMRNVGFVNQTKIADTLREIWKRSEFKGFVYEPNFLLVDQQESTLNNLIQNTGIAVGVMLLIALLFIPKFLSALWIGISIISINLGVVGGLAMWGSRLDIVSMITIVMSVGFSVDFAAHITYHYLVSRGEDRLHRALRYVGAPIVQSAASTALGVASLSLAESYMVRTFVKTVLLVISLGLLHGLMFLPVILSICVPTDQYLDGLSVYKSRMGHYFTSQLPQFVHQIRNKRMRAYFSDTTRDSSVPTSEESLGRDLESPIQDVTYEVPSVRQNSVHPSSGHQRSKSVPHKDRSKTPRQAINRHRSSSVRTVSALYDFLKYKNVKMAKENAPTDRNRDREIYSEIDPQDSTDDVYAPVPRQSTAPQSTHERYGGASEFSFSDDSFSIHNFDTTAPKSHHSATTKSHHSHHNHQRRSYREPSISDSTAASDSSRELQRTETDRMSHRLYVKRDQVPRHSRRQTSHASQSSHAHYYPPPPREVQAFPVSKKRPPVPLPPIPASETVQIVLNNNTVGTRSSIAPQPPAHTNNQLQKVHHLHNSHHKSMESLAESDLFQAFRRTKSGRNFAPRLSLTGDSAAPSLSTFKGARELPPAALMPPDFADSSSTDSFSVLY